MITELILKFLLLPITNILNILPDFSLSIPDNILDGLSSIFSCLGFIFPIKGLLPILAFSLSIKFFHIIWALILRIKSFIPTEGN